MAAAATHRSMQISCSICMPDAQMPEHRRESTEIYNVKFHFFMQTKNALNQKREGDADCSWVSVCNVQVMGCSDAVQCVRRASWAHSERRPKKKKFVKCASNQMGKLN